MSPQELQTIFTQEKLAELFPSNRSDLFFDALFGDAEEGAYDITLHFNPASQQKKQLEFELHLSQRPGRCLACNLTHGLPQVFTRHPVINIAGLVTEINQLLAGKAVCTGWELAGTRQLSSALHIIPLQISLV